MSIKQINDIACYGWVPDFVASNNNEISDYHDAVYSMDTRIDAAVDFLDQLERITKTDTKGCILTVQGELALSFLKAEMVILKSAKNHKKIEYCKTGHWAFGENQ